MGRGDQSVMGDELWHNVLYICIRTVKSNIKETLLEVKTVHSHEKNFFKKESMHRQLLTKINSKMDKNLNVNIKLLCS